MPGSVTQAGQPVIEGDRVLWNSDANVWLTSLSGGLDFRDLGYSYREILTLFGYPISEEFTDPGAGLTVQCFERGRLEYHPENPPVWQVEGGLLGDELAPKQGLTEGGHRRGIGAWLTHQSGENRLQCRIVGAPFRDRPRHLARAQSAPDRRGRSPV